MASLRGSFQLISLLAGLLLFVTSTLPAASYLAVAYNRIAGGLEAGSDAYVSQLNRIISLNPALWELQEDRITTQLKVHGGGESNGETRVVLNAGGETVARVGPVPRPPVMVRHRDIMEFGEVVGRVEVSRSLRGTLVRAVAVLVLSWGAALGAFSVLRGTLLEIFLGAEKALRESERKYRKLFSSETVAIVIADAGTGRFIDVNETAVRLYGYDRDRFLDLRLPDISAEPDKSLASVRQTLEKNLRSIPLRFHRKSDGTVFPVEISVGTFSLGGRRVVFGMINDIGERVRGEHNLLRYQRDLQALGTALARAEDKERRDLAAILHDDIGQLLAMCKLNLEEKDSGDAPGGVRDAEAARRLLDRAIARTRSLTWDLSSQTLYELGLEPAIEELCSTVQQRHGLRCALKPAGAAPPLSQDETGTLYRAVRELLHNVIKHAGASRAEVTLARTDDTLAITVADDGRGFAPGARAGIPGPSGGFGLFNIRERIRAFGGDLAIGSSPGGGASVTLSLPLAESRGEEGSQEKRDAHQGAAG